MAVDLHTIDIVGGSDALAFSDRLLVFMKKGVASPAGSGSGAAVTIPFSALNLPQNAMVFVSSSLAAATSVTKTGPGAFTVTITPPSGVTLAAGTFDLLIIA